MREPQFGGSYGLGFFVRERQQRPYHHQPRGGGIPGQSSNMVGDVDAKVGVYYMSNSGAPSELADAAIALLRGEEYVPPPDRKGIAVDPKILDSYVGVYEADPEAVLTITREGGVLVTRWNDSEASRSELLAETPTRFFMKGPDLTDHIRQGPGRRGQPHPDRGRGSEPDREAPQVGRPGEGPLAVTIVVDHSDGRLAQ